MNAMLIFLALCFACIVGYVLGGAYMIRMLRRAGVYDAFWKGLAEWREKRERSE